MKNSRGIAPALILIGLAVVGAATWLFAPKLVHGASRRAAASTEATANLETATNAQGASAAASVAKIGEANTQAPASPAKEFIAREVPVAMSRLPAPDPVELLQAEKRRAAVMEGQLEESRRLYEGAAKQSATLQRERDEALAARRAADLAIEQAAAAEHARTTQAVGAGLIALLAVAGWLYLKFNSVGIPTLGKFAADVRAGTNPIAALDAIVDQRHHAKIERFARLHTPVSK
jgi:hypothetical protein